MTAEQKCTRQVGILVFKLLLACSRSMLMSHYIHAYHTQMLDVVNPHPFFNMMWCTQLDDVIFFSCFLLLSLLFILFVVWCYFK